MITMTILLLAIGSLSWWAQVLCRKTAAVLRRQAGSSRPRVH